MFRNHVRKKKSEPEFLRPTFRRGTQFFSRTRSPGRKRFRPEFIALFETLANIGTKAGVEGARIQIHAPLIKLSKAEIIRKAAELQVDLSLTHSCYDPLPDGRACGECDSCKLRLKGFREAGFPDPIKYAREQSGP